MKRLKKNVSIRLIPIKKPAQQNHLQNPSGIGSVIKIPQENIFIMQVPEFYCENVGILFPFTYLYKANTIFLIFF